MHSEPKLAPTGVPTKRPAPERSFASPRDRRRWKRVRRWLTLHTRLAPFIDPCEFPHRTVLREGIELDEQIAPLVELLWKHNVETVNSCQGDPSLLSIMANVEILGAKATVGFTDLHAAITVHCVCFQLSGSSTITTLAGGRYHHVEFDPRLLRNETAHSSLLRAIDAALTTAHSG